MGLSAADILRVSTRRVSGAHKVLPYRIDTDSRPSETWNHFPTDGADGVDRVRAEWRPEAEMFDSEFDQVFEARDQIVRRSDDADAQHALVHQTPAL